MHLRVVSWNVLADTYMLSGNCGDYSYVTPSFMTHGARLPHILNVINSLRSEGASLIALQEAEETLVTAVRQTGQWQTYWSAKTGDPVGRLMLVSPGVIVNSHHDWHDQESQLVTIGEVNVVNAHISWAPADEPHHPGVRQASQVLRRLNSEYTVILTDSNDRPGGPVRALLTQTGFINVDTSMPTAYINGQTASLDLVAVRGGIEAKLIQTRFGAEAIPNRSCPSDHIPVIADLSW